MRVLRPGLVLVLALGFLALGGGSTTVETAGATLQDKLTGIQLRLLSGYASMELETAIPSAQQPNNYMPRGTDQCPKQRGSNVKVNQNCLNLSDPDLLGRGQAQNETYIAVDPNRPSHLIATYNDYRRGDGTCGATYSRDGGRTWNDATMPTGFVRGGAYGNKPRQYFQAGGDPSVAFDSKGNAYYACLLFKRGPGTSPDMDFSNGIYVYRSTQNGGASWNFPGRPVVEQYNPAGNFLPLNDKQFMAVDNSPTSPFKDRIYVSWTEFQANGAGYIRMSYSADYGETFTPPKLVSVDSPLCPNDYGIGDPQGRCNANQFSQPFVGTDGALYIVFNNYNNAETLSPRDNRNQILLVKSVDGGSTFSPPLKVADFYDLPDCLTYQGKDAFRACVPEKGPSTNSYFRAANYPSAAVDPTNPNRVVVGFASYINRYSNESNGCIPMGVHPETFLNLYTGVKTPGACNNDIIYSVSNDGGLTFTGTTIDPRELPSATAEPRQRTTDQWFQWIAYTKNGRLATSYYDRQYGDAEFTGFSDFSLSVTRNLTGWTVDRITGSSMPPPTQFEGNFWGDYTGLTAHQQIYPLWSDTRDELLIACRDDSGKVTLPPSLCAVSAPNAEVANDQEIYVARVGND
jgi:hypothetical protein